jgi:diguanylate cyclase (GGDEF)-like protein
MVGEGELIFVQLDNTFGHVVLHDKVVCTNHPASHPASRGTPRGHPPIHSFLGIPLHHEGEVVGMIALANRNEGYHLGMVEMLEPLTTTLGTLINARATDEERSRTEAQLLAQATSDSLTGLANRRRFFAVVEHMLPQIRRYGPPATVALVDLDHFKQINDQFGHATGDAVLRAFGPLLEAGLRETDLAARIGGEEFAVFMPSTTAAEALIPLERIRQELAKTRISSGGAVVQATASIGVCEWRPELDNPEAWLSLADEALYRAKAEGRNRIRLADAS